MLKKIEKNITNDDIIEYPIIEKGYGHNSEWCTQGKKKCNPVSSEEDIVLYFVQSRNSFTLSFNSNGGNEIESKIIEFDEDIGDIPVPEKEGFEFIGWFVDPEFKNSFYSMKMPGYDMCLYAKWRNVTSEEKSFGMFIAIVCVVASVVGGLTAFIKRDAVALKH